MQIIFSGQFGLLSSYILILKIEFSWCPGAWPVLSISVLVMNKLNTTDSVFFHLFGKFLVSKGSNDSELI